VYPGSEAEVAAVLNAALVADAVVIPFGGGSSISGSLEASAAETRPVISVDLGRLDKGARDRRTLAPGASRQPLLAVRHDVDRESLRLKRAGYKGPDPRLVLDNQYSHSSSSPKITWRM